MTAGVLAKVEHRWECPACGRQHVTHRADAHTPLHQCPKLRGAWAPFVAAGVKAKLTLHEREDYVGRDHGLVQTDGYGRPVMSVTTTRDDGEDCHVFAPVARIQFEG